MMLVGTYSVPATAPPVEIAVDLRGSSATVALGRGHAASTPVHVTLHGTRIQFTFPGGLEFDGVLGRTGTVRHGAVKGTFRLRRGVSRALGRFGLYRSDGGEVVTVDQATGFPQWLVELPGGAVHGIGSTGTVGRLLGETAGDGTVAADAGGLTWHDTRYARVRLRQREIRVGALAATLTLPPGPGPFPAVAMVHGSGPNTREEFQTFAAYCASLGIAVLADDKRGIGQSLGRYPGEAATASTLDVLARDAQSEVRYLARLPQVDPKRVGLLGDSQAGWIIALAASREPAARWAVSLAGPTTTVGESDYWGSLAGRSQTPPTASRAEMLKQVRALGPSGFDPRPYLAKLAIPALWIFGDDDRNIPTDLSIERLQALQEGRELSWVVIHSTHALLELPNGLYSSLPQSHGFAPGLYPAVGGWLRSHGIVR
jgi:dienelactone hydrolase